MTPLPDFTSTLPAQGVQASDTETTEPSKVEGEDNSTFLEEVNSSLSAIFLRGLVISPTPNDPCLECEG